MINGVNNQGYYTTNVISNIENILKTGNHDRFLKQRKNLITRERKHIIEIAEKLDYLLSYTFLKNKKKIRELYNNFVDLLQDKIQNNKKNLTNHNLF